MAPQCKCNWASDVTCRSDDGSMCHKQCCQSGGGSSQGGGSGGSGSGGKAAHTKFCPAAEDIAVAYGNAKPKDRGWSVASGGGAATKAAFDLLGGWVEFDIDVSNVKEGVNANIYTISPDFGSAPYDNSKQCDGSGTRAWCPEVDWLESNGNCGAATTLHTRNYRGGGCDYGGCQTEFGYNGNTRIHMRVEYGVDGSWTTIKDGQKITNLNPSPEASDWAVIKDYYSNKGAVIISTQWTGWVPCPGGCSQCGAWGDLGGSSFSVSNLVVYGTVKQGPSPRQC